MAVKSGSIPRGRSARAFMSMGVSLGALLFGCSGQVSGPVGALAGAEGKDNLNDEKNNPGVSKAPLDCTNMHVGYTPLQRLSRDQYANSVRDLLAVTFDNTMLSDDERVGVFDGNVVAPVTDLVVDQYASAAERVAQQALPNIEKLVPCDRKAQGDDACVASFVDAFGLRAYRRPLSAEEKAAYVALYGEYKGGGYPDALRVLVQTMLQSPNFLYRVELQPVKPGDAESAKLDAYELASRLSFFLLSTTPDDALLAAAQSGELLTDEGLSAQTERLIEDARFSDTLASFHTHWLELQKLSSITKDTTLFPMFTANVASEMLDDTLTFIDHVFRKDDAKLETLLTASYGFPGDDLATLYGVKAASGDEPVQFDPAQRAGVLTHPSFLATHSHFNSTSPVERGKVVIRNVLCQTLADPPPDVNTTPPDPSSDATMREQLKEHQQSAGCATCHKRIDGIGLGFEQFDAIGAFRTTENGAPVDSTGEFAPAPESDLSGAFADSLEMVQKIAASNNVKECVATQWLRFALGRLESDADQCTLDALFKDFAGSDNDLRVLLSSIALSDAFRNKRVDQEASQ